jgi:hypothetical protein
MWEKILTYLSLVYKVILRHEDKEFLMSRTWKWLKIKFYSNDVEEDKKN